ncbi:MAG TPA: peptide deformylase [Trueperaceae bacterium]|nr:peptide deformylase [Trueperaceae bacterium]
MIHPIRYFGDPVLRKRALPVTRFDEALRTLADDMIETMYDANGVGLAAPQIGVSKRLFVALELAPEQEDESEGEQHEAAGASAVDDGEDDAPPEVKRRSWGVVGEHVMVNPSFVSRTGEQFGHDGCLSVPGLYVDALRRDLRVRVRYQDVTGGWHQLDAEGHFAHVLQHEYDHLEGVLFFDRLPEDERRAFLEEHRAELADMQRQAKALIKELRRAPIEVAVE